MGALRPQPQIPSRAERRRPERRPHQVEAESRQNFSPFSLGRAMAENEHRYTKGRPDEAFERLYRAHRREVYRFVLRDVGDPQEAEDVTQIAFLDAYRALARGNRPDEPRPWLFTIARNASRRRFRRPQPDEVPLEKAHGLATKSGRSPSARRHRVNRQAVQSRVAALHRACATAILTKSSSAKSVIGLLGAGGRLQQ